MRGLDPDLRALQEVRDLVGRAHAACEQIHAYDQARIDRVCKAMAEAGAAAAHDLARTAVEETGIGRVHYKVLKNLFGSEGIWSSIKDERTVGIIGRDDRNGVIEVATPVGVVAGIVPTTNPTSTALGKALIAVKGKNAIVFSPHPRSRRCIGETVEVLRRAIERAGAPPDLVCALSNPTIESTGALMKHPQVAIILATGGAGLVEAAYSSGKPAYGVGPGNVPCYIDRSADVQDAARWIVASQSFDNGTLCCSEQGLVVDRPIAERLLGELKRRGAYVCNEDEIAKLARVCNRGGHMHPDVVGLDPWRVAEKCGFSVARSTSVLLAPQGGIGPEWPLSIEILCPLLSVHVVDGWEQGCRASIDMLRFGGLGHTMAVWARDEQVLERFYLEKPANRIVVNGPASEGAVGYSTGLVPSMSLGCGPQAGNITSDNISAKHLINVKRVALRRRDWETTYERDHRRAAAWTGERAPRGSGLAGDPALAGSAPRSSSALAAEPTPSSNWQGNPSVNAPRASASGGAVSAPARSGSTAAAAPGAKVQTAVKARPTAPTFVRPRESAAPAAPAAKPACAVPDRSAADRNAADRSARPGVYVGAALRADEIRGILAHAGTGCPLGPCQGCPHLDVRTGACTA